MIWGLGVAYFLWLCGMYGFGLWLPSLIHQVSAAGIGSVSLLTVVPFGFAALGLYLNTKWSKAAHHAENWHFIVPMLIGGVAILLQPYVHGSLVLSMFLLIVTGTSIYCGIGIWWAWTLSLVPRNQVGLSTGLVNLIGNIGGVVGPILVGWAAHNGAAGGNGFYVVGYALIASALLNSGLWALSRRRVVVPA
ncbi:MAG: hypothetical protein CPDRYMAC_6418 [uncultured Paraburkholderia sp.]|nr:MAG: hypothetical protein CPDRYDRY_6316 [uncultured Paraburkholderia sp.]CAH2944398.1 MAG: hypothetical protein CPDRYMAC_6418 [uncultured Paraburkholderia sp.]